jgi:tetratricopeptide (TPR) repeat protein/predicted Ser/Thr protein kinase
MLSHYRLVEKIGQGGMGVVWKAEDTVLGRTVAIKVLPADLALDEERRRMFLDEARLAASVAHGNIAQVYELGREGDLDFIVMELVEGKPLKDILNGRPLLPTRVAAVGEQVARALSRAHRKGLLHRDLKPANILITPEDEVKVVDFGVATLFSGSASTLNADDDTAPLAGTDAPKPTGLVGTFPYMSPEQVRGERPDHRGDIFSLGTVLYEMTTGQRPFAGRTKTELLQEILKARPVLVHDLVAEVPHDLDRVIQKAMAPDRADRYQSMEDLAVDLKRLRHDLATDSSPSYAALRRTQGSARRRRMGIGGGAGAIAVAFLGVAIWRAHTGFLHRVDSRTVLILPMEVRGQSEGAEYVGRAFSEAIAINLSQAKDLHVLAVPPRIPGTQEDPLAPARAAKALGAGRILSGALTRDGQALRASLSLLDSGGNRVLWGTEEVVNDGTLPGSAASLARQIATALGVTTSTLYDYYLYSIRSPALASSPLMSAALGDIRRTDIAAAVASTSRLVEAFPNEPEALVVRGVALCFDSAGLPPTDPKRIEFEEVLMALRRADPDNPWADCGRGIMLDFDGRHREAHELFTKALARQDLTPAARAVFLTFRSQSLSESSNTVAALADLEEAIRLDPVNDLPFLLYGSALSRAGRHEEAMERCRQAVALNPTAFQNQRQLARDLGHLGRWEEALDHARLATYLNPTDAQSQAILGEVLGRIGRWGEASVHYAQAFEAVRSQSACAAYAVALLHVGEKSKAQERAAEAASMPEDEFGPYAMAQYRALHGETEAAIRLLQRSLERTPPWFDFGLEPEFDSIRDDPGFVAILAEAKKQFASRAGQAQP